MLIKFCTTVMLLRENFTKFSLYKNINQNISFIKLLTKYLCKSDSSPLLPFFLLPSIYFLYNHTWHEYILSMQLRRMLHSVISMRSFGLWCQQTSILNSKQLFVLAKREKHDIWWIGEPRACHQSRWLRGRKRKKKCDP